MRLNRKKFWREPIDGQGFVLVEFAISLPLLILLLYALGQMALQISKFSREQAADYVLEYEAWDVLQKISEDARAAYSVEVHEAVGGGELYEIFFNYNVASDAQRMMTAVRVPRRYTVGATSTHGYYIYSERQQGGAKVNPISGGNFLGETSVTQLKFSEPSENVLHITLELQSAETGKKFKVNTSVYMSACEVKIGL